MSLQQLTDQLQELETQAAAEISAATTAAELEQLRVGLLGKKGRLSAVLGAMGKLPGEERPLIGQRANVLKDQVQALLGERLTAVNSAAMAARIARESIDVTAPCSYTPPGHRHPLISTIEEIVDIFAGLGYRVEEGPEIETDHYNFTALNIPPHHPARDMQDTFYLSEHELLRTHTSPVQIRSMLDQGAPIRIIAPGRVYRSDSDATHTPMFHQVEGLLVDRGATLADLKGILDELAKGLFGSAARTRFRPGYYPFTEPSVAVDVSWPGSKDGWMTILGAGMVHPVVLENGGIDPETHQGFAFGLGIERVAMRKYGIGDIRLLFENDARFLRQF